MKITMRLVAAAYRTEDVAVELFGRTADGRSVTGLFFGFHPYFDVVSPDASYMERIQKDPEFVRSEKKQLWYEGKKRDVERVFIKSPWKVPEYRNNVPRSSPVLAADIPFHHRFIYDNDLGACVEIEGEPIEEEKNRFTTDLVIRGEKVTTVDPFNLELKILSFDVENLIDTRQILVIGWALWNGKTMETGSIAGKEKDMLQQFVDLILEKDPDVLTGYNIDGYDLPLIFERAKALGVSLNLGRDFVPPRRINNRYWRLHGRVISDTWWNVKKFLHPKNETLNYVAKEMLNEGKDNINRLKIGEEWKNRQDEVIAYCVKDARLTLEIFRKLRVMDRNMFMAAVAKLPIDDVTNGGTSNYVDSILIRQADRDGFGVPMTSYNEKEEAITGGYVHSIGAGLYSNVVVLDFKSMYPSMIMKYNICFTTLSPDGNIVAPNGIRFLDRAQMERQDHESLIPRILKQLMDQRDRVKSDMKKASPEEREFLDGVQGAIKILMNTFYGVLASSFYRFTNPDIGAAVTAYARMTITELIEKLQKEGNRVIYGDTDSVFIESGEKTLEDSIRFGEEIARRMSSELEISLEFEKIMDPFFSHGAKKRYAGKIVFPREQSGEILVRGYEVRRTDSFGLQSRALSTVFDLVLKRDMDGARKFAHEIISKVLAGDPEIELESLVISRSVRSFSEYKDKENSLANVRVAKMLMQRGEPFVPGMKVSWIVTNSRKSPQEVEPYIEGSPFVGTPDWHYYARRVEETLNRVLEGVGEEMNITLAGKNQSKLTDTPAKKAGNKTLDSF